MKPFLIWKYDARTVQFASSKYNDFMPNVLSTIIHVRLEIPIWSRKWRGHYIMYESYSMTITVTRFISDFGRQLFFQSCICGRLYSSYSRNIAFASDIQFYLSEVNSHHPLRWIQKIDYVRAKFTLWTSFWPISRSVCPSNRHLWWLIESDLEL